jgi:predicted nucleic acid-binding protein
VLVVSDTSPLNLLAELHHVDILAALFGQVLIPPEVADELSAPSAPPAVRAFIAAPPTWLIVRPASSKLTLTKLDPGEVAAISLAHELSAPLLIDERAGRTAALAQGITIIGAIGVLERAADQDLIPDLAAVHASVRQMTFRVADAILDASFARHQERKKSTD